MTGSELPGLGEAQLASLGRWLAGDGVELEGKLTASLITGGRSNLTFLLTDGSQKWVLRRPPLAGATDSAHDVGREYQVTHALRDTDVPVAATVASSDDLSVIGAPFTVVEFVHGRAVRSEADLADLDADVLGETVDGLVDALTRLHRVDPDAVGLAGFGRPGGYAARQLRRWPKQWEIVGADASPAAAAAAEEVVTRLRRVVPEQHEVRVVHGDYRIDNTLLDPSSGSVRAIVDWELSTLGDPLADVAMMCVYREQALNWILGVEAAWTSPRLPSGEELARRYERASGRELRDWDFWMALSFYKLAVIAAGIDYRWRTGATVGDGFDTAHHAVEPLMVGALGYALVAK